MIPGSKDIKIVISIVIAISTIMIAGILTVPLAKQVKAQSVPHITITEAYANAGHDAHGNFIPWKKINQGDVVISGQPLQFRIDFNPAAKIIHVYCAIDGHYSYDRYCSTPFEGRIYSWILNTGIPTNNFIEHREHTFSILVDTDNGRTNTATFQFWTPQIID